MAEPVTATPAATDIGRATRVPGESRYPNYDLASCLGLAKKVKDEGGNSCTIDQLGGLLGYKNTRGGGFSARVANAKQFGLIENVGRRFQITRRAESILYPASPKEQEQGMVDAFLAVPLYRRIYEMHKGQRLPEALGMQNLFHRLGIPAGERCILALRVMMDSADQAGFFKATQGQRANLVIPIMGVATPTPTGQIPLVAPEAQPGGGGGGGDSGGTDTRGLGVLVNGVIAELPRNDSWDESLFQGWMEMLELALRVRYKLPKPK